MYFYIEYIIHGVKGMSAIILILDSLCKNKQKSYAT